MRKLWEWLKRKLGGSVAPTPAMPTTTTYAQKREERKEMERWTAGISG